MVETSADTAILYADETRIQLLPLLRAMWSWVGQQIRVPTPGSNDTRMLFGALDIRSGKWTYLVREHMRKEDFIVFLEHLLSIYTGPIILIADNYSNHTATVVQTWLAEHPRLKRLYLPKYCSHLNPVEEIWLHLKNRVEIVGETMRQALNQLAEVDPDWLKTVSPTEWFTRYNRRF